MGDVVNLLKGKGWVSGPIRCTACKHEWVDTFETGCCSHECPKCKTFRGVSMYHVGHVKNSETYSCKCGCNVFLIIRLNENAPGELCCIGCGDTMIW